MMIYSSASILKRLIIMAVLIIVVIIMVVMIMVVMIMVEMIMVIMVMVMNKVARMSNTFFSSPPSLYHQRDGGRDGGDDHGDERRCVNAFLSSPPSLYYSQVSLYLSFSLSEHSYHHHHHHQLYQSFKSPKNEVLEDENDMGRPFARDRMISAVSSEPFRVGATFPLFFHCNTYK